MARRPSWRLAVVVLVVLIGVSAVAAVVDDDEAPSTADPEAFLEAWARSRAATYRSVSDFTRTSNSTDAELTDRIIVAQRPPDRLSIDGDGATGIVDGRRLACTYRRRQLACQDAEATRTYDEDVARQLATLRGYVTGDDPLYTTTAASGQDGDCFTLRLTDADLVAPPLGRTATYCFDPEIGAPTRISIERDEADDDTRVVSLSDEVTDAHLDPDRALDR